MKIKKLAVMFMISTMFITSVAPVCAATKKEEKVSSENHRSSEYRKKQVEKSEKEVMEMLEELGLDPTKFRVGGDDEEVTYKLSKSKLSLEAGKTKTIKVSPDYSGTIKWTTSDKTIATVSSKGKIKAVKAGTCTIAAKLSNGTKLKCKLTVTKKEDTSNKHSRQKEGDISQAQRERTDKMMDDLDKLGIDFSAIGSE